MQNLFLPFVFMLILFSSCTAAYEITVHENGSATIGTPGTSRSEIIPYYQSDMITRIDTTEFITYDIVNIDSLGNYLPYFQNGFFQFSLDSNTLKVSDGHGNAFKEDNWYCCGLNMTLIFEEDIVEVQSDYRRLDKKNSRVVYFWKAPKHFKKKKNQIRFKVIMNKLQ